MSNIQLLQGDCIKLMKEIPDSSVDMVLTDPPYNISVPNNFHTMKGRQGIDFGEWDKGFDIINWIEPAVRKLKNGGNIIIFNAWKNMGNIAKALESCGCSVKELVQWQKLNPMPRNRDRLYVTACEFAVWGTKGNGWTFNRQRDTYENAVFQYPVVHATNRVHPTQKPVKLLKDLILIHSNPQDVVLDCFMGSGSTGVASVNAGRNFIGMELDQKYFEIAKQRIEDADTQLRLQ